MKKPFSLKFINFIIIAKLVVIILFILLLQSFNYIDSVDGGVWQNFKLGVLESYYGTDNVDLSDSEIPYMIGRMTGNVAFPAILLGLNLLFIRKFMYKATVTMMVIQIAYSLQSNFLNLILAITLLFIVLFNKNTKNYLKQRNTIDRNSDPSVLEDPQYL